MTLAKISQQHSIHTVPESHKKATRAGRLETSITLATSLGSFATLRMTPLPSGAGADLQRCAPEPAAAVRAAVSGGGWTTMPSYAVVASSRTRTATTERRVNPALGRCQLRTVAPHSYESRD